MLLFFSGAERLIRQLPFLKQDNRSCRQRSCFCFAKPKKERVERVKLWSRAYGCAFSPTQTSRARLEVVTFLPCSSSAGAKYTRCV